MLEKIKTIRKMIMNEMNGLIGNINIFCKERLEKFNLLNQSGLSTFTDEEERVYDFGNEEMFLGLINDDDECKSYSEYIEMKSINENIKLNSINPLEFLQGIYDGELYYNGLLQTLPSKPLNSLLKKQMSLHKTISQLSLSKSKDNPYELLITFTPPPSLSSLSIQQMHLLINPSQNIQFLKVSPSNLIPKITSLSRQYQQQQDNPNHPHPSSFSFSSLLCSIILFHLNTNSLNSPSFSL